MNSILEEIQKHLQVVVQDPTKPLDHKILHKLDTNIIENLSTTQRRTLVNQLAQLLPTLQQDPTSIADLATTLVDSDDTLKFTDVIALKPEVDFTGGLQARAPSLNKITLALLQKAKNAADAGLVAGKPDLVIALVNLWLRTPQTTLAEKAKAVLIGLLTAETPEAHDGEGNLSPSQGLMWRRMFGDKDVYGLIYSLCSLSTLDQASQLTRREKTIAQGRLLDLVQDIFHAPQIWKSQIPEVEQNYGVSSGNGLLEFAAVEMIDYKDDVLIHMTLIDFFTKLIARDNGDILNLNSTRSAGISAHSSEALDFLISKGLHERTMSFFLDPDKHDSLDATYLYSSSTRYISTYASHYTTHFLRHAADRVLRRLSEVIGATSNNAWAANNLAPSHDLKLLAQLPQRALLALDKGALALSLPTKPTNIDALYAIGAMFKGPLSLSNASDMEIIVPPPSSPSQTALDLTMPDRQASRALFFLYAQAHPELFRNLVSTAETVAIKDRALAAVSVINAIVDSSWATLPDDPDDFPSEGQLENQCSTYPRPLATHGVLAVLQPPVIQHVMPYLMKGPENGSEAAWEVAVAKHAILGAIRRRLKILVDGGTVNDEDDWKDILATIEKREQDGPAGSRMELGLGGQIPVVGTMGR